MSINTFFILASTSKSRFLILKTLKLNFIKKKPACDENYYKNKFKKLKYSPKKISLELSKRKAISVSTKHKNTLVVGSDTIIEHKGKIIEKAKNLKEAKEKLNKLSGKKHFIISSAAVYYNKKLLWSKSLKSIVKIRKTKNKEITEYLKVCGPTILNSVGCYQIEKQGPIIIESINGDFFNVRGFPLFLFLNFLLKKKL